MLSFARPLLPVFLSKLLVLLVVGVGTSEPVMQVQVPNHNANFCAFKYPAEDLESTYTRYLKEL